MIWCDSLPNAASKSRQIEYNQSLSHTPALGKAPTSRIEFDYYIICAVRESTSNVHATQVLKRVVAESALLNTGPAVTKSLFDGGRIDFCRGRRRTAAGPATRSARIARGRIRLNAELSEM